MGKKYDKAITPAEKKWLLENYFTLTPEEISEHLGRKWEYCTQIARRVGLYRGGKHTPKRALKCDKCQLFASGVCIYHVEDDVKKCRLFRYTSAEWQKVTKWDLANI